MEIRFSFHPVNKILLISDDYSCHADTIAKFNRLSRHKIPFDKWIRGIIKENKLYLRLYYPFDDIEGKTLEELEEASFNLLFDAKKDIIKALKTEGLKVPSKLAYNVTNEYLLGVLVNI